MNLAQKHAFARALDLTGGLRLLGLLAPAGGLIFALHRVLPEEEGKNFYNPHLVISPSAFDQFLTWLRREYRIVSLAELVANPVGACALTFDDGWEDNFRFAFPILKKHRIPASIFLVTGLIGTKQTIPEERLAEVWTRAAKTGEVAALCETMKLPPMEYREAHAHFKRVVMAEKLRLLDAAEARFGARETRRFMDWQEVETMRDAGIEFGSHTSRHTTLGAENQDAVRSELEESSRELRTRLGGCATLAYPNGSYDRRVEEAAKACGYRAAVTMDSGRVSNPAEALRLPRIAIDDLVVTDGNGEFSSSRGRLHVLRNSFASRLRQAL